MERGDLVAASCGILSASSRPPSSCPVSTKLILDFVLVHTYTSTHGIKMDTLATMEETKCRHYSQKYHEQGFAFAPLVANSFAQLGPEFLRFLWALADQAACHYIPVPLPVLPALSEVGPPEDSDSQSSVSSGYGDRYSFRLVYKCSLQSTRLSLIGSLVEHFLVRRMHRIGQPSVNSPLSGLPIPCFCLRTRQRLRPRAFQPIRPPLAVLSCPMLVLWRLSLCPSLLRLLLHCCGLTSPRSALATS